MRCVIMAGGRGERLRPLTDTCPKPLLPVAGRPVLDRLLEKLAEAGIQDVTLAVGYLGQMIEDYCGDGDKWGLRVDYVRQNAMMGTAGALTLLRFCDVRGGVMVANGDKVLESAKDIADLVEGYGMISPEVYIATIPMLIPYGVVDVLHGCPISEKPTLQLVAGFYVIRPSLIMKVEPVMDMPTLVEDAEFVRHHTFKGYVLDIGTPQSYQDACARLS